MARRKSMRKGPRVNSDQLKKACDLLKKRSFSAIAASVIAGATLSAASCDVLSTVLDPKDFETFDQSESIATLFNQVHTFSLEKGDWRYLKFTPSSTKITVSVASLEGTIEATVESDDTIEDTVKLSLEDNEFSADTGKENYLCIKCTSATAEITLRVLDPNSSNQYSDWTNWFDYSDWTNWSNYSNTYSRYSAYSDSWLNYSNYWMNSW